LRGLAVALFVLDENLALEFDEVVQVEGVTEREAQLGEQFSEIALRVKALSADVQTDLGVSEAIVVSREVNRRHVLRPGLQFLQPVAYKAPQARMLFRQDISKFEIAHRLQFG
jgi:hypothetical protein